MDRAYFTTVFTTVLYLATRGYEPLRAEMSRDGTGRVGYLFSPAARDEVDALCGLKDRLNRMGVAARSEQTR
jgi:hypothetical protein